MFVIVLIVVLRLSMHLVSAVWLLLNLVVGWVCLFGGF